MEILTEFVVISNCAYCNKEHEVETEYGVD